MGEKIGRFDVRHKKLILVLAFLLAIPAWISYQHTRINYDLLTYLPSDIETMQGQDLLQEEFDTGAFAMMAVEGMEDREVAELEEQIEEIDGVKAVLWYDTFMDLSVPKQVLPDELYEAFNSGDATLLMITFEGTSSSDETMAAVRQIRRIADARCFLGGMSAVTLDTEELADREAPVYVLLAVALCLVVLLLTMDSRLVPFFFLLSIGLAIIYNLGTNHLVLGQMSYITQCLAAVLQLGVTLDYSIFLWHSYEDQLTRHEDHDEAMVYAVQDTFSSIIGSSVTTIAGFVALCFMSFSLGLDIGYVMAKGVLLGVISCVTILPSMLLCFDKALQKTRHKAILPDFKGIGEHVRKHTKKYMVLCLILLVPAFYGYNHLHIYYKMDETLPRDLPGVAANEKISEEFNMECTHVLLLDRSVSAYDVEQMAAEMEDVDGVQWVLGLHTIVGPAVPEELLPEELTESLVSDQHQLILIGSAYEVASDEVNAQIETLHDIARSYDSQAMLIGEAPCTRDLITIASHDFNTVTEVSVGIIFVIIALVFRSVSVPIVLVSVIEFGIAVNMGLSSYLGTQLPFIANIVIGTIQLGSTVDYGILETTRYLRARWAGRDKDTAISEAVQSSAKSIFVSGLGFFCATAGVGLYSEIDMISCLCLLMARGALISVGCVIFLLPSLLLLLDKFILKTTRKEPVEE